MRLDFEELNRRVWNFASTSTPAIRGMFAEGSRWLMTGVETATTVGATVAILKAVPPAASAGKRLYDLFGGKELTQTRQERDDARKELAASQERAVALEEALTAVRQEAEDGAGVINTLAEEVIDTQAELGDIQSAFDEYRKNTEIAFWAGGSVIVVLLVVVAYMAVRHG